MFQVMGALEALSGELACARITDEELAEIRALHYQMILHHTRHELGPYFRLNQAIHEKILDAARNPTLAGIYRSEEHTSELQSLMRISYAVFCLKKKKNKTHR